MAKTMLADVLWKAANERLRSGNDGDCKSPYTCDAVYSATGGGSRNDRANRFLCGVGLPKDADSRYDVFNAFELGDERQGVRYMWLLLAMHVAEDEGIEL